MHPPLMLADFGAAWFTLLLLIWGAVPLACGVLSVIVARRKREDQRSGSGVILGIIAVLVGAWVIFTPTPDFWTFWISYVFVAQFLLGAIGIVLSLRRKKI